MRVRNAVVSLTAAFTVLGGITLGAATPAHAINRGDAVAMTPAPGSSLAPHGDAHYFVLKAKPGDTIEQKVRITNPNKHADTVNLEAVDGSTADETGAKYGPPGSPKATTGRWVAVSTPQITLQPGEQRDVSFSVHVPSDLGPGQYLAGVSASVPVAPGKKNVASKGDASFNMDLQLQRVVAVEVDVPGAQAPNLVVTGAEPKATVNGIVLGIHMANQGNAFAHGQGVIRVADTKTDYSFELKTFVSQTAIVYPMPWTKDVVPGLHTVQVDLTYEGGHRTTWNGTVNIAGQTQTDLENGLRHITVGGHGSFNWWLIVGGVVLLALIVGGIVFRRRNRRPRLVKYRTA
jgi:LPXTG-motif cell wall-anchored protein